MFFLRHVADSTRQDRKRAATTEPDTTIGNVSGTTTGINVTVTNIGASNVSVQGIASVTGGNATGQYGINVGASVADVTIGANGASAAGLIGNVSGATGINISIGGGGNATVSSPNGAVTGGARTGNAARKSARPIGTQTGIGPSGVTPPAGDGTFSAASAARAT